MALKQHQPAITITDQIENLKQLGLIINDEEFARNFLNDVSYFRFEKAYSLGLKDKNGMYYPNITFDTLVELYMFNSNFRHLIFEQIEHIEVNFRCRISNYFSETYGIFGYYDANNFRSSVHHTEFINEINKEIQRNSKSPFVKNFTDNYDNGKIPFYALIELFSFGTLSKFYKNMKNPDKKAVAKIYGENFRFIESWIENIAFVRNVCAHYGRLYNINITKTPLLSKKYTAKGISSIRIFATLLCFKHLLPNDRHWIEFVDNIELLFEKYPHVQKKYMGFPDDWYDLLTSE